MLDNVITLWVTAAGVPGMSVRVEVEHIHEFLAGFMWRMDQIAKDAQVPRARVRMSLCPQQSRRKEEYADDQRVHVHTQ